MSLFEKKMVVEGERQYNRKGSSFMLNDPGLIPCIDDPCTAYEPQNPTSSDSSVIPEAGVNPGTVRCALAITLSPTKKGIDLFKFTYRKFIL